MVLPREIQKRLNIFARFNDHVPAVAAVAAVRTALGTKSLTTKADATRAAVPAAYQNFSLINKHGPCNRKKRAANLTAPNHSIG
jgi:hypothetical protein